MDPNVSITQLGQLFINVPADTHGMEFLVFLEEASKIVLLELIGMEINVIVSILNLEFSQELVYLQLISLELQQLQLQDL